MSSIYNDDKRHGPENLISKKVDGGFMAHAKGLPNQWMRIDFPSSETISKVVINNRECGVHMCGRRIIGCTLTVTVNNVIKFNHVITEQDYIKRIGDALTFFTGYFDCFISKVIPRNSRTSIQKTPVTVYFDCFIILK
jgi:hypothetical protein